MLRDWTLSDKVDVLSVHAERFFTRLIMKVDDYGCFNADTRILKAALFPLKLDSVREADLLRWMAECQKSDLIVIYEVSKKRYLQINDFKQRLDRAKSKYPLPTDNGSQEVGNDFPPEVEREIELKINTPNGVVPPPNNSIPVIEKKNDKTGWNEFVSGFESLGNDLPEKNKHTIQRTELKKFIEENKPQYPEPYFTAYRLFALKEGLSIPETLSESRKKKFKVRIKEPPFDFYKILEGIHNSKFCRGDNNRNWKVDWDWVFENDQNYIKIIENKFE